MKLELKGITVKCILGELPEERTTPQTIKVDPALELPDAAAEGDTLTNTVDYVLIAERVREALTVGKYRMLESAAKAVAEAARVSGLVKAVSARVTKTGAIAWIDSASAEFRIDY